MTDVDIFAPMSRFHYLRQLVSLVVMASIAVYGSVTWPVVTWSVTIALILWLIDGRKILVAYLTDTQHDRRFKILAIGDLCCLAICLLASVLGIYLTWVGVSRV